MRRDRGGPILAHHPYGGDRMCEELELLRCAEAEAIARHNRLMRLMRECGLGGPVGTEEAAQWFILKEGTDAALRERVIAHDRVRQHQAKHSCQ